MDGWSTVTCGDDPWCPTLDQLKQGVPLPEAIHLYDREGRPFADVAGPLRRAVPAGAMPPLVADAFVAVEDRRFRKHWGIDARGVLRAMGRNVLAGGVEEGGSTIPMQLVRTLWAEQLRDVGRWRRKAIGARMAPELVRVLGRDGVLTAYLDAIYLGNGIHGVSEASRYYFGASLDSLRLSELATLVGMTQAPEHFEPRKHPERARARRDVVLNVLVESELVAREDAERARAREIRVVEAPPAKRGRSYATAAVTREIRRHTPSLAGTPGLHVYTTLDMDAQAKGEEALREQLEAIERGRFGPLRKGADGVALQGAAVAVDPATGAARAWIGGRDFANSEFDRVDQARRPVGSLVKPFIVAAALERGRGIVDPVSADPLEVAQVSADWVPADHVEETALPMREVLIRSSNRAAVLLGFELGLGTMAQVASRLGLAGDVPELPSAYVGAFDASLLEMAVAYAALANGGTRVTPYLIERIENGRGHTLWIRSVPEAPTRVFDARTSFVVLDAMRDVVDRGTGVAARYAGYTGAAAGKTGTTDDVRDAWFVGATPDLVAGVWIGYDMPGPTVRGASGGVLAAPVWGRWMAGLDPPPVTWPVPPGVTRVQYDRRTGRVVSSQCQAGLADDYLIAYVRDARYVSQPCGSGLRRILNWLWRSVVPSKAPRAAPLGVARLDARPDTAGGR